MKLARLGLVLTFFIAHQVGLSQCAYSGLSSTYCINSASVNLNANITGGIFSGPGMVNGNFNPSAAGIGTHVVTYSYCSSAYSLEAATFTAIPNSPIFITLGDNQLSQPFPIGFNFKFYCNTYSDFYISSNGYITFSPQQTSGCCQGLALPTNTTMGELIACAWTDLDPSQNGTIRYLTMGTAPNRALLVSFNCIFHKYGQGPVTSEIWLYETSNVIEINTTTKPIPTGSVSFNTTMGIQNGTGLACIVPGRNGTSNWTATAEKFQFIPGVSCLTSQTTVVNATPIITAVTTKSYICKSETTTLIAGGGNSYVWDNLQTSSTLPITPSITTVYTVTGMDVNGCTSTATVQVKVSGCSGINEPAAEQAITITVYPNPNTGEFSIQSVTEMNLKLINELGEEIRTISLNEQNNNKLVLTNVANGIYMLIGQKDNRSVKQKIIVSH